MASLVPSEPIYLLVFITKAPLPPYGSCNRFQCKGSSPLKIGKVSAMTKLFAEFIGTFTLVLFGCGSAVLAGDQVGQLGISLAFGLSIVAMAYGIGRVSGCHINPAVSFGAFLAGRMGVERYGRILGRAGCWSFCRCVRALSHRLRVNRIRSDHQWSWAERLGRWLPRRIHDGRCPCF